MDCGLTIASMVGLMCSRENTFWPRFVSWCDHDGKFIAWMTDFKKRGNVANDILHEGAPHKFYR